MRAERSHHQVWRVGYVSSLRDLFDLGKRLEDLGYVDGKNIILIARDAGTEPKAIEDTIGAVLPKFRWCARLYFFLLRSPFLDRVS